MFFSFQHILPDYYSFFLFPRPFFYDLLLDLPALHNEYVVL